MSAGTQRIFRGAMTQIYALYAITYQMRGLWRRISIKIHLMLGCSPPKTLRG
jgi:hypothetical protein